jgi:hypothetical protein
MNAWMPMTARLGILSLALSLTACQTTLTGTDAMNRPVTAVVGYGNRIDLNGTSIYPDPNVVAAGERQNSPLATGRNTFRV